MATPARLPSSPRRGEGDKEMRGADRKMPAGSFSTGSVVFRAAQYEAVAHGNAVIECLAPGDADVGVFGSIILLKEASGPCNWQCERPEIQLFEPNLALSAALSAGKKGVQLSVQVTGRAALSAGNGACSSQCRNPSAIISVNPSGGVNTIKRLIGKASVKTPLFGFGDFSLHLDLVGEQDIGMYKAQAVYGEMKHICKVMLRTIQVTQSPPGLVPESSSVILQCSTSAPKLPVDNVFWFHRGVRVYSSTKYILQGQTLQLKGLTQDDRGDWSCEVNGVQAILTLQVLGFSGPASVYTAVGSRVELPCALTDIPKEGSVSVYWHNATNTGSKNAKGQVLILHHVSPEDAGKYRCDITFNGHLLTRWIDLKVIQVEPSGPGFVMEGSRLHLECNVRELEGGEQYEWTGPPMQRGKREVMRGAVVDLSSVQSEDSGMWNCSVYGRKGYLGTVPYMLHVHAAQMGSLALLSSWQSYVVFLISLLLVLGLAAIATLSFQNRRRRLSHLAALKSLDAPCTPTQKSLSI
ncbi:lymphocyte activation gene 3 protein [Pelodytes ibericus]